MWWLMLPCVQLLPVEEKSGWRHTGGLDARVSCWWVRNQKVFYVLQLACCWVSGALTQVLFVCVPCGLRVAAHVVWVVVCGCGV